MNSSYYTTHGQSIQSFKKRIGAGEFENKMEYTPNHMRDNKKNYRVKYREENKRLEELFRDKAISACGLENHKNGYKAFAMAWDDRHSEGYYAVFDTLCDLAELLVG